MFSVWDNESQIAMQYDPNIKIPACSLGGSLLGVVPCQNSHGVSFISGLDPTEGLWGGEINEFTWIINLHKELLLTGRS